MTNPTHDTMTPFRARIREIALEALQRSNSPLEAVESAIYRAIEELLAREPSEGMRECGMDVLMSCSDIYTRSGETIIVETTTPASVWESMSAQLLKELKDG